MRTGGYRFVRLGCLVALWLVCQGTGSAAPSEMEMNGIVTVPGDKRVFIKTQDAAGREINYMLVEGQSRGGIKLLSVDMNNNVAVFDNHGTSQILKICPTPELTAISATSQIQRMASSFSQPLAATDKTLAATDKTPSQASTAANPSNATGERLNSGYAPVAVIGGNSSTASGSAPPDTTTGANPANETAAETPSASASSSPGNNTSWWYTGSQDIEQARLETADAVRQGVLPPYPLTPLTPPGTPPELIGPGQAYFNHFTKQYRSN